MKASSNNKVRKVPLRKCLGCDEMKPKKELVRVVKNADGEISLDLSGRKPGRGAYVCPLVSCFEKARKGRRFEKSLSCKIPEEVYDLMKEELSSYE